MNRMHSPGARAAGFTLIEALIAMLIIMIGMLGVAGMQALAIHNSTQARIRTLAGLDAHSLAAVMRANSAYWTNLSIAPTSVSIVNTNGTLSIKPSSLVTGKDCASATCTAAESAGYAVNQWAEVLKELPSGAGASITQLATAGTSASAYAVTVNWSEKQMQAQGAKAASATPESHSTTVVVSP